MALFNSVLSNISDYIFLYILSGLLIICGLYFTFRTRLVQFKLFPDSLKFLKEKSESGRVSSFQALMISTATKVGTANISGVAMAIVIGGPGAVFWMWIAAMIGSASAVVECTLAQIYKEKSQNGNYFVGGPAYYIKKALNKKWLGMVFSVLFVFCFICSFNPLHSHNMSSAFETFIPNYRGSIWPYVIGIIFALLISFVVLGGIKRIGFVSSYLVPIMATFYLLTGLLIIILNFGKIPNMFAMIFHSAFNFRAIFSGVGIKVIIEGIKRGLLSNEAGMGSSPNSAATADTSHPVKQGIVQIVSVGIDTFLICTTSAFIILLSGVDISGTSCGIPLVQNAVVSQVGSWGAYLILFSVITFAFSAIIGNFGTTESNILFIKNNEQFLKIIKILGILPILWGCIGESNTIWSIAEIAMAMIAVINIVVIVLLSKKFMICFKDYLNQRKNGNDPVFKASQCGFKKLDCWD